MKAIFSWSAAALLIGITSSPVLAQCVYCAPALHRPLGYAPNTYGPGYYCTNCWGMMYGPNYCLRPPFPPEQGIGPGFRRSPYGLPPISSLPGGQAALQKRAAFPTHPYARSPRDFFMFGEAYDDELSRLRHPALIP